MKGYYGLLILLLHGLAWALLEEKIVAFEPTDGAIELRKFPILRDASDPVGVKIATDSLASDLEEVTGIQHGILIWDDGQLASTAQLESSTPDFVIIAATVDSPLASHLEEQGKINVDDIRGKWETFRTTLIARPLPGVDNALVIVGSDKRGTMFGVFTLSEQIGKSP